ncbi:unnamed protein product [Calypogeia fissa]
MCLLCNRFDFFRDYYYGCETRAHEALCSTSFESKLSGEIRSRVWLQLHVPHTPIVGFSGAALEVGR